MTPDSINTILKSIERVDGKLDAQSEAIHEAKLKLTEIEVIAREARADIRLTNGRVTAIERREERAEGAAQEHRRMESAADHDAEKWQGILPTVIAGVTSGVVVIAVAFLLEHL